MVCRSEGALFRAGSASGSFFAPAAAGAPGLPQPEIGVQDFALEEESLDSAIYEGLSQYNGQLKDNW